MLETFEQQWAQLVKDCPVTKDVTPAAWAKWMRENGRARRMHGGVLDGRILDNVCLDGASSKSATCEPSQTEQ